MTFQVTLPKQLKEDRYVTFVLSGDSPLPTINGQWTRWDENTITAWYTRPQLCEAVLAGLAIEIGQMQDRLEKGEQLINEAKQRGDEQEAAKLQRHWVTMLEHITRLLDAQAQAKK